MPPGHGDTQGWPSPGRGEGVGPGQGCWDHWAFWNIVPKGADHELDFDLENNRKGKGASGALPVAAP